MRYDEIDMNGSFLIEKLTTLPTWTTDDKRRLLLIDDSDSFSIYFGDETAWKRLDFPTEDLTGDNIFVAYDGSNFYLTDSLPNQTGNDGYILKTNGISSDWHKLIPDDILPSQTGQTAKFLQTDGSNLKWSTTPSELPTKAGNNGKILTVDTTSSTNSLKWVDITDSMGLPNKSGHANEFLKVNAGEDDVSWDDPFPIHSGDEKFLSYDGITKTWKTISEVPAPTVRSVLMTDGSTIEWDTNNVIPEQLNNDGNVLSTNGSALFWTDVSGTWITEDTTWYIPTTYATLELALIDLNNYYVHPNATLTIYLTSATHNISSNIIVKNRGKSEGDIVIKGASKTGTILTSSDFGSFSQGFGFQSNITSDFTFISLNNSKIKFETLSINGPGGTTQLAGLDASEQSQLLLEDVIVKDFYNWNILVYNSSHCDALNLTVPSGGALSSSVGVRSNSHFQGDNISISISGNLGYCFVAMNKSSAYISNSDIQGGSIALGSRRSSNVIYRKGTISDSDWGAYCVDGSSIALHEFQIPGDTVTFSNIKNVALGAWHNSMISGWNTKVTGSGTACFATGVSFINVVDPDFSDNTLNFNPSLNTSGNQNSYITNIQ